MLDSKLGDIDRWRPVNGPDYELSIASAARPQISEAGEYLRPCCFTHYPHFSELEESVTVGCQICALILNSLGAQKCLNYRRSGWPVRLCLLPISHGDQSIKRFRICIGKTTSPLTQTLLELEYYQRCGMFHSNFITIKFLAKHSPRKIPNLETFVGPRSVPRLRNFTFRELKYLCAACPELVRYML